MTIVYRYCVEYWLDLEKWVRGHPKSSEVASIERPYDLPYYWSAILCTAVPCTIFEFDVEYYLWSFDFGIFASLTLTLIFGH